MKNFSNYECSIVDVYTGITVVNPNIYILCHLKWFTPKLDIFEYRKHHMLYYRISKGQKCFPNVNIFIDLTAIAFLPKQIKSRYCCA